MSDSTNQRKVEHIEIITGDQQIDRPQRAFGLSDHGRHRVRVGDVGLDQRAVGATSGSDQALGLVGSVGIGAIVDRHARAAAAEMGANGPAQAARAAGHQGRAARKILTGHGSVPSPRRSPPTRSPGRTAANGPLKVFQHQQGAAGAGPTGLDERSVLGRAVPGLERLPVR